MEQKHRLLNPAAFNRWGRRLRRAISEPFMGGEGDISLLLFPGWVERLPRPMVGNHDIVKFSLWGSASLLHNDKDALSFP